MTETAFGYCNGDTHAWFSTDERKWINWAKKMAAKHPKEVVIKSEHQDGTIVVAVPINWFKLSPPKKMNLTEEQRRERSQNCVLRTRKSVEKEGPKG